VSAHRSAEFLSSLLRASQQSRNGVVLVAESSRRDYQTPEGMLLPVIGYRDEDRESRLGAVLTLHGRNGCEGSVYEGSKQESQTG